MLVYCNGSRVFVHHLQREPLTNFPFSTAIDLCAKPSSSLRITIYFAVAFAPADQT
jgi:hypothetical protein